MSIAEKFDVIADKVYEVGKETENCAWWDGITNNNQKSNYDYAFYQSNFNLMEGGFNPPYTLKTTYANFTFDRARGITKITKEQMDFSSCLSVNYCFDYCYDLEEIEEISINSNHQWLFAHCTKLKTIGKLILREGTAMNANHPFIDCISFENISIEGIISKNVSFKWCSKLTRESILGKVATDEQITAGNNLISINGTYYYGGIWGALKTLEEGETATITLHADVKARLSEAEIAIATQKGWTVA